MLRGEALKHIFNNNNYRTVSEPQGQIPVPHAKASNSPPEHGMGYKIPYVD